MQQHLEKRLVGLLSKLILEVENKRLVCSSLLANGRLSYQNIFNTEYWPNGVSRISRSSMLSCPSTYYLFRKLKFLIEERDLPKLGMEKLNEIYASDILEFQALPNIPRTTADLSKENYALYSRLCLLPDWPRLKNILLPNSNADFIYWSDQDLIDEAGKYKNFTQLKTEGGELRRHITGRELDEEVIREYPIYNTHSYIGLGGYVYRSQGELILGNMIVLAKNENDFLWQVNTHLYRENSNKPMTSDFYCKSINLHIEVSMFVENGRGERGEFYDKRRLQKLEIYKEANLNVLFIDSSKFYINGCIEPSLFAKHIIDMLHKSNYNGLKSALDFNSSEIGFFKSADSRPDLDCKNYCDFLAQEHGLTHMSQLSNDKSYLLASIKLRPDSSDIFAKLKQQGAEKKRASQRASVLKREYADLDTVRKLAKTYKVLNQTEWANFAKNNRGLLKKEKIPANVSSVYARLGKWKSWMHFFELARN